MNLCFLCIPFLTPHFLSSRLVLLIIWLNPFLVLEVQKGYINFYCILHRKANSVDIDQMPQNSAFELGRHCLYLV